MGQSTKSSFSCTEGPRGVHLSKPSPSIRTLDLLASEPHFILLSFLYLISLESIPLIFQHFSLSHLKAHMPRSLTSLPTIPSVQPTRAAADNPGYLLSQRTTKFFYYDTTQKGLKQVTSLHAHGYFPKAKQPLPLYFKYRNTLIIWYPQIHSSPLFTLQPTKQAHFGKLPNPNFNFFICKVLFFRLYRIVAKIK